ncbi:MAG TPA: PEP-CTERM sorting domain-containing protein [Bryobacteraceae bacterium]|nr:PEP-CTERM sorting domain-containing protein [Bryobacteraceae bacterium]
MRYLCSLVLFLSCAAVSQASVVVPNSLANTEGNANNNFPFDSIDPMRYQQVYAADQFPGAGLIDSIAFRPDGPLGEMFSLSIANIEIDLSTTQAAPDALSDTFADNVGPDNTVVYSGPLTLSSANTGPAGGPKDFDIVINFMTPFFYNPGNGNLLLDVKNNSGTPSGLAGGFDSEFDFGDSVSRVHGDIGSPTASVNDTEGLVTEFSVVPEPGTLALLFIGSLLVFIAWRLRVRT